nr:MAG TPA: hypothetical protein [Caudoviricetes sp.]
MSKNKKYEPDIPEEYPGQFEKYADDFEKFLDITSRYIIPVNITEEEERKARKTVRKLIKHLRSGNVSKVIDEERFNEINSFSGGEELPFRE